MEVGHPLIGSVLDEKNPTENQTKIVKPKLKLAELLKKPNS